MRKSFIILSIFLSFFSFAQSNFSNGFSDGYKKGYCQNQGVGCLAPIPPIAPIPIVNENMNSYQDGYNKGFETGLNAQKTSINNSTRQRYQTAQPKFIDFTSNSNSDRNGFLELKMKAISTIMERAKENLENENYDAAIENSNDLLNIQPGLAIAYVIKSNAQYKKGETLNAYNNSAKANNILNSASPKEWYEFMYNEMSEYLKSKMRDSNYIYVKYITENFWYKNNLSNYYLGLANYNLGDLKAAKKAFKKVDNFIPAKEYLERIKNETSPKKIIKKPIVEIGKTYKVASEVPVNSLPGGGNIIDFTSKKETIFIIERVDKYFKVKFRNQIGYILSNWLED